MNTTIDTPILVIGAGPAGLAVGAELRRQGLSFELLEKDQQVASAWHRHYDRLRLHTIKEYSHLPGMPFPDHYPRYVTRQQLVDYYEAYARHHQLEPRLGRAVYAVSQVDDLWLVSCDNGETYRAAHVVFATGLNRVPYYPRITGQEHFPGQVLHSSEYRNPEPYRGKKVLVVGMGNSGAEIALDLSEAGVATWLSVRGPVNIVPREVLGRPTQKTAFLLAKLPTWLADRISLWVRQLTVGDLPRYGLKLSDVPPSRQLRETGQTPVIDLGTLHEIRAGRIKVLPGIDHFHEAGVVFKNGDDYPFDAVVMATGYRAALEDLLDDTQGLTDEYGWPRQVVGAGRYQGLYFVGFDNYSPGGGLGIIRRDAQKVAEILHNSLQSVPIPTTSSSKE